MKITSHKLVVDPTTFNQVLVEISYPPRENRKVDPAELSEWTEHAFRQELIRCGYPDAACTDYIKQENVGFAEE